MSLTLTMLGRVLEACPDELWTDDDGGVPIWQEAYHSLVGIFFWLRDDMSGPFEFPAFHNEEAGMMVKGAGPPIARELILDYYRRACERCEAVFGNLTPEQLTEEVRLGGTNFTLADRILSQIRHVQHHTGCMYSLLRRRLGEVPDWATDQAGPACLPASRQRCRGWGKHRTQEATAEEEAVEAPRHGGTEGTET
jgi:hypothetical protein